MPNLNAKQRARDAADFAALDGTKCEACKDYIEVAAGESRVRIGYYSAFISCTCHGHRAYARTRYRAIAMALAAYRAAREAGK